MSISERLREERSRLGMSQTAFASLAGVTKSAQIKWEAGTSSAPTAPALAAMANAGADVLYILTGRRTPHEGEFRSAEIERRFAAIRFDIRESTAQPLPGETASDADKRVLKDHSRFLKSLLDNHASALTDDQREEADHLWDLVSSWAAIALNRAHHSGRRRARRREVRDELQTWLSASAYEPGEGVFNLLATLVIDHGVPMELLVELVEEMRADIDTGATTTG